VPVFGVMITNFVSAVELMAKVLGMPGYAFAIIDHSVSSATDAGLRERAVAALKQGSGLLLR